MSLGVGIIGAGGIARAHIRTYREIPDVEVKAVFDVDAERAKAIASEFGLTAVSDLKALLERSDIDAVSICTPHAAHESAAGAAAQAGKHILCEKPLSTTIESGRRMIEAARRAGVILMVAQTHRFWPANVRVKELLQDGVVGEIVQVVDTILSNYPVGPVIPWRFVPEISGGGVFIDNGVHAVDRLRWWLESEVKTVYAKTLTAKYNLEVENSGFALLTFESGIPAVIHLSMIAPEQASLCRAEFLGTEGILRVDTWGEIHVAKPGGSHWERIDYSQNPSGITRQITEFVQSIVQGREPSVPGEEGLRSLAVIEAIYRAAAEGRVVRLTELNV